MAETDPQHEFLRGWLKAFFSALHTQADGSTRANILEACGRTCAELHGPLDRAQAVRNAGREIDELLDWLSLATDGLFAWERDGPILEIVYRRCFCPLRASGAVDEPALCDCSRGWLLEVFETACGRPVAVELKQAIGRGDPICRFLVRL